MGRLQRDFGASGPSEVFGVKKPLLVVLPGAEAYKKLGYWYEKQESVVPAWATPSRIPRISPSIRRAVSIGMHLKPSDANGLRPRRRP
jgi:hypothetical protein